MMMPLWVSFSQMMVASMSVTFTVGYSVGYFFVQTAEGFFADKLGYYLAHGLVCYGVLIEEVGSVGQVFEYLLD